ncbi:hypothetical protein HYZ78_02205 [Candidatus Microgenomates bacterium]|nr:hypothetical protein [Candidatus Microgenomates bacterium]
MTKRYIHIVVDNRIHALQNELMSAPLKKWLECGSKSLVDKTNPQSGQALVIILLVLAVASTIAISLASRSVTDISITTKERESARAFSAAEAGVEEALIGGSTSGTLSGGETFSVISASSGGGTDFVWPGKVSSGEAVTLWLVSHKDDGTIGCGGSYPCYTGSTISVCWGEPGTASGDSETPAIAAQVVYLNPAGSYAGARIARVASDPNSSRRANNNFADLTSSGATCGGESFAFSKNITFSDLGIPSSVYDTENGLQAISVRLIYNTSTPHPVAFVSDSDAFPIQGTSVTSTGTAESSSRKIEVFQTFAEFPTIFGFGVSPGGAITK